MNNTIITAVVPTEKEEVKMKLAKKESSNTKCTDSVLSKKNANNSKGISRQ